MHISSFPLKEDILYGRTLLKCSQFIMFSHVHISLDIILLYRNGSIFEKYTCPHFILSKIKGFNSTIKKEHDNPSLFQLFLNSLILVAC